MCTIKRGISTHAGEVRILGTMAREIRPIERVDESSDSLPLFRGVVTVTRTRRRRSAQKFLNIILLNKHISTILDRLGQLSVEAWITSGCLVQTWWNVRTRQSPHAGIDDYDLIYYDEDMSWNAEDAVIRRAKEVFGDLPITVQVRNQARVPLWYSSKFGISYPPVREAPYALLRYPSRTTAIAITRLPSGQHVFYAPFGFEDAFKMRVRPNKRLDIRGVYEAKTRRWSSVWPTLKVEPWNGGEGSPDQELASIRRRVRIRDR